MIDEGSDREYDEPPCCLLERLRVIEQKLDHIIYRLSEEDPRTYRSRRRDLRDEGCEDDNGNSRAEQNGRDRSW